MTVTVVNLKKMPKPDFRADRSTALGNPFYMNRESERELVCDQYEAYFLGNLNPDVAPVGFLSELDKILQAAKKGDITIGCWCAPKRCHCDTIKEYIDSEVEDAKVKADEIYKILSAGEALEVSDDT